MTEAAQLLDRLQARSHVPLGAHLQLADRCNHKCGHCYQLQGGKGELRTDQWLAILDRLADQGVLLLNISGGEATLRPDLVEILSHARSLNFAVRLFTNGLRVNDELADQLARLHLLSVEVSLYSHLAGEHDHLTGVPGSWERATSAIRLLTTRGVNCTAKWVVTTACSSTLARMGELAFELGATLQDSISITSREDGDTSASDRWMLPLERLTKHVAQRPAKRLRDREELLEQPTCGACRTAVVIGPDGKYRVCPAIPVVLGDALVEGIGEAAGSEVGALIAGLRWKDIPGCSGCALVPWCERCHGEALVRRGDVFGPYEAACRMARASFVAWQGGEPPQICSDTAIGPFALEDGDQTLVAARSAGSPSASGREERRPVLGLGNVVPLANRGR